MSTQPSCPPLVEQPEQFDLQMCECSGDHAIVPYVPPRGGRPRKLWEEVGRDAVKEGEKLCEASKRWLKEKKHLRKPLMPSSNKGRPTLIAKCDA